MRLSFSSFTPMRLGRFGMATYPQGHHRRRIQLTNRRHLHVPRIIGFVVLCLLIPPAAHSQQAPGLRGFTNAAAAAQLDRERRFQAVPAPDNLRDYMRAISAEPHHAGAPGSRKVAEYILDKFKSWGLNAAIEEAEALMPFPVERVVELVAPDRFTALLKEPVVAADPDSGDAGQLPTFNAY